MSSVQFREAAKLKSLFPLLYKDLINVHIPQWEPVYIFYVYTGSITFLVGFVDELNLNGKLGVQSRIIEQKIQHFEIKIQPKLKH